MKNMNNMNNQKNKLINSLKRSVCLLLSSSMFLVSAGCSPNADLNASNASSSSSQTQTQANAEKAVTVNLMDEIQSSANSTSDSPSEKDQTMDALFQDSVIDFSVRLFQQVFSEDFSKESSSDQESASSNIMISPLSVLTALSMTLNGAEGDTQDQMLAVLFSDYVDAKTGSDTVSLEEINKNISILLSGLPSSQQARFLQANSIWFRGSDSSDESKLYDFQVNPDFLQTNADYYNAELFQAPFNDETLTDINNWCSEHTEQMIPQLLDEIPPNAVMYLINALAFDAVWESTYQDYQIFDSEFTNADETSSTVSMMCSEEHRYLQMEHAAGFIKPYAENYSFAALLPDENTSLADLVANLSGEQLINILSQASEEDVTVQIPQFTSEYSTDLAEVFQTMDMDLPFDAEKADFRGITVTAKQAESLSISRILHKTYISVNEKGTQAAAATAVELAKESCNVDIKQVILNRPFIYFIIDQSTNLPIFMGTVTQLP